MGGNPVVVFLVFFFFSFQKGGLLFDREQFMSAYGAWC